MLLKGYIRSKCNAQRLGEMRETESDAYDTTVFDTYVLLSTIELGRCFRGGGGVSMVFGAMVKYCLVQKWTK